METVMTKPTLKGTDRLAQTMAALARLLDQTMNDIKALDSEFQEELGHSAESLKIAMEEAERNLHEIKQLREAAASWEGERARLQAECERAKGLADQAQQDHTKALAETDEAAAIALERQIATAVERVRAELTSRFEADRATLLSDRNRAQQRLADMATEFESLKAELEKIQQAPAPAAASKQSGAESETLQAEVARVEAQIKDISRIVEDHETELSVVIRKNVERAELESYLRGLRFKGL
jgi:chromosome segregation ATPase